MKTSNLILVGLTAFFALGLVTNVIMSKKSISLPVELAGNVSTRSFESLPLKHINLDGPIRLILSAGIPDVQITADEALLDVLVDKDDDPEVLHLSLPDASLGSGQEIVARISTPILEQLTLSGETKLETPQPVPYPNLQLKVSGGITVDLKLEDTESLSFRGSGGGNVRLSGAVKRFSAGSSGGIDVDASALSATIVDLSASGGNEFIVHADSLLTVSGSGSTKVEYSGSPRVNLSGSGSAKVIAL